jgi:hypothetical protein
MEYSERFGEETGRSGRDTRESVEDAEGSGGDPKKYRVIWVIIYRGIFCPGKFLVISPS